MNWYDDHSLTIEQQDYVAGLEELRIDLPVIWALLCGTTTSAGISALICWPHTDVLRELRALKAEGMVFDVEGQKSVLWNFCEGETEHLKYQDWIRQQRKPGGLFYQNEGQSS